MLFNLRKMFQKAFHNNLQLTKKINVIDSILF